MSLHVVTHIDPIEIDGQERKALPNEADELRVVSHWNMNGWVILEWHGHSITVLADSLERAIHNARTHR